ncbi:zn2-c6 fungal-type dna-binding domain [Trichoderma cornu-damae]|uniref:Zn2-c6 fungal-type dna-binding domain n=1 Tax=Trichoderma cornu-damae TaxID=654480 RepID=A0A9P8QEW0_9HYPO|nr:zn2-c6 fungal-type dna-binding domain [Trichoderma cornu-damae]
MVGVPGRSKGCVTCRRRKKGCDKNVPSCHQCIRSGLQCGGYERDLVWVNTTPDGDDAGKAMPQPPDAKMSSTQQRPWRVIYTTKTAYNKNSNATTTVALHDSLARSAREELYFGMLISTALPYGHLLSAKASGISTNGWVAAVDEYYHREPAIRYAAQAMSVGFIGVEDRRKQVTQPSQLMLQGLEAYNRAIHEMVKGLRDPKRSKNNGVLVAARILQSYESIKDKLIDIMEDIPFLLVSYDKLRACRDPGRTGELRRVVMLNCQHISSCLDIWEKEAGTDLLQFDYTIAGSPLPVPKDDTEFGLVHEPRKRQCVIPRWLTSFVCSHHVDPSQLATAIICEITRTVR